MSPLTPYERMQLYLYSNRNISGCVLALAGLGLFFTGIIHAFWWLIVPGLYLGGALAWPRNELAQIAEHSELNTEMMALQMRKLVDSVAKGLPREALAELNEMQNTLTELLPKIRQLESRGVISAKESFTVTETVRRYLPDTLGAYLRLPRFYAEMQNLAGGQSASELLTGQLRLLNKSLREIVANAYSGDAEKLAMNGRFLQSKFSETTAFRP
jgi:hypothetical protein